MSFNTKSKDNNKSMGKAILSRLSDKISLYICPMLLGASICFSVIYTFYKNLAIPYTLLFLIIEYFLFVFFDKLKSKKFIGGLIYTVILIVVVGISIFMTYIGTEQIGNWRAPMLWFYGLEEIDTFRPLFLNAVFIGGGFFIISILYYFTQVRYRTLGVMLCILFPFVIYSRRVNVMPEFMATVIVMLYLAVVVHNRRTDPAQQQRERTMLKIDRSYIISIAIFVSVTGTITMMIEKPVYISKLERNANYFDYALTGGAGDMGSSLEELQSTSSPRYGAKNYNGEPLFYFDTNGSNNVYYLRTQPYDKFNGDVWEIDYSNDRYIFFYTEEYPEYSIEDILNDMQSIFDESGTKTDINPKSCITVKDGRVYSDSFNPVYLPAPLGTITEFSELYSPRYIKFIQSSVYRGYQYDEESSTFDDSFEFYDQTPELYGYAKQLSFSAEDYIKFLSQNNSEAAEKLLEDYISASELYSDKSNISNEVAELAVQITENSYSDIEKAFALEQYFEQNGYIYDEDYVPDNQSIDYFIFDSKTGVCTSYATAMTLMARSINLPARYVEGFAAFEKSDEDTFVIRDKHAHAFVEVYIPGAGWLTFDPTVSDYMEITQDDKSSNFFVAFLQVIGRFLIVIVVAVFVIFIWLSDRIIECIFRIRQMFGNPKEKTLRLYANVIKLINFSSNSDYSSYTVNMLREYINSTRGAAPEQLLQLFERTAFGGYNPTSEEYRNAYLEYKKCYKYLRKIPDKT